MGYPTKGRADYLDLGDWNAVCSMCGRKRKASTLEKNWQGMWRCPEHNEPRQPQDFVRGIPDIQTPPWVQPPADEFVDMPQSSGITASDTSPAIGDTITITVSLGTAPDADTVVVVVASTAGVVEAPFTITILAGHTSATGTTTVIGAGGTILSFGLNGVTQTVNIGVAYPTPTPTLIFRSGATRYTSTDEIGQVAEAFDASALPWGAFGIAGFSWDVTYYGTDTFYAVDQNFSSVSGPYAAGDVFWPVQHQSAAAEPQVWFAPYVALGTPLDGLPWQRLGLNLSVVSTGVLNDFGNSYTVGDVYTTTGPYCGDKGAILLDSSSANSQGVAGAYSILRDGSVSLFLPYGSGVDSDFTRGVSPAFVWGSSAKYLYRCVNIGGQPKVEVSEWNVGTGVFDLVTYLTAGTAIVPDTYYWQGLAATESFIFTAIYDPTVAAFTVMVWTPGSWTGTNLTSAFISAGFTSIADLRLVAPVTPTV